jgi:hypothetical protein
MLVFTLILLTTSVFSIDQLEESFEFMMSRLPQGSVVTITEFTGNFADEFTQGFKSFVTTHESDVNIVDFEIHRVVLLESLRYSEPVFDDRFADTMPSLRSPDISLMGSSNLQGRGFMLRRRQHLDFQVNLVEIATGIIILNHNERIIIRHNIPYLLLAILIGLILGVTRLIIHLRRGYNVFWFIAGALFLIVLIIMWFII